MDKSYIPITRSPLSGSITARTPASMAIANIRRLSLTKYANAGHCHHQALTSATPTALQTPKRTSYLTTPPPPTPLSWLWQCHICRRHYNLSVTRRCIDDGHYFCSGAATTCKSHVARKTSTRNRRITRPGRVCASEFDYAGWKRWGIWRRGEMAARRAAAGRGSVVLSLAGPLQRGRRNCEGDCDYPSECRWGSMASPDAPRVAPPPPTLPAPTSFEEILGLGVSGGDVQIGGVGDLLALEKDKREVGEFFEALVAGAGGLVRSAFEDDDDEEEDEEADVVEVDEGEGVDEVCLAIVDCWEELKDCL